MAADSLELMYISAGQAGIGNNVVYFVTDA